MSEARFLEAAGRRLEYFWHGPRPEAAPTLVFLHEGLGSAGLWRDFPEKLAAVTGCGALVYTRAGYGGSDPVGLPRPIRYMHDEALDTLPAVLVAAEVRHHILVGHSDGASIVIIHAGAVPQPGLMGLALEAPHVFTEAMNFRAIAALAEPYQSGGLREKLRRWHGDNVDIAFRGWYDAWSDPAFRQWNIEAYLRGIKVPALIIQGEDDEYGTIAQVDAISRESCAAVETLLLPDCGHSPHRDQPERTLQAMRDFIAKLRP